MSTTFKSLSRREEDEFQKQSKLITLRSCDKLVSEFANCSTNRPFSVVWCCRTQWKSLQECLKTEEDGDLFNFESEELAPNIFGLKVGLEVMKGELEWFGVAGLPNCLIDLGH